MRYKIEDIILSEKDWQIPSHLVNFISPKVKLFLWMARIDKVASKQNLQIRGVSLEDEGRGSLYGEVLESINHLNLLCSSLGHCG